jgi:hypothetical protein
VSGSRLRSAVASGAVMRVNSVRKLGCLASTALNHSRKASHSDENGVSMKPNLNVTGAKSLFKRGRGSGGVIKESYHIETDVGGARDFKLRLFSDAQRIARVRHV